MRTDCRTVYFYDELPTDAARATAREWYRRGNEGDLFFAEWAIDDFKTIAARLGITFRADYRTAGQGKRIAEPRIAWSGFGSQGDGASFEGSWAHTAGCAAAVKEYAPTDETLHAIALELEAAAGMTATIERFNSHYCHDRTVRITVYDALEDEAGRDDSDRIAEALRGLMRWLYRQLEAAHDDQNADDTIAENIRANEYEFTADGRRI